MDESSPRRVMLVVHRVDVVVGVGKRCGRKPEQKGQRRHGRATTTQYHSPIVRDSKRTCQAG